MRNDNDNGESVFVIEAPEHNGAHTVNTTKERKRKENSNAIDQLSN